VLVDEPVMVDGGPASKPLEDADDDEDDDEDFDDDDSVDPPQATIKTMPPPNADTIDAALFIVRCSVERRRPVYR
jgi:hypothetical protein